MKTFLTALVLGVALMADAQTNEVIIPNAGIGVVIFTNRGTLSVAKVAIDSPADKAGIHAFDKIMGISGVETTGMPLRVAVERLRGEEGTLVNLTIQSITNGAVRQINLIRQRFDDARTARWRHEVLSGVQYEDSTNSNYSLREETNVIPGCRKFDSLHDPSAPLGIAKQRFPIAPVGAGGR